MLKRNGTKEKTSIDRLPPHSPEAEEGVLGCVLLSPRECIPVCIEKFNGSVEVFYDLKNQLLFGALMEMYEAGQAIDVITVQQWLKDRERLDDVGGIVYLSVLPDSVPSSANIAYYADIVREKHLLRKLVQTLTACAARIYDFEGEADELLASVESEVLAIRQSTSPLSEFVDIPDTIHALQGDYEAAMDKSLPMGIKTGFYDLDHICGGMMEQELIVLAGQPSTGKTSLALNLALNVARAGVSVGFVSLETSGKKILHRMACSIGRYDGSAFFRGTANGEVQRAFVAFNQILKLRNDFWIWDGANVNPAQLGAVLRRMAQKGARLFIVDYLQLLVCQGRTEYEKATLASKTLKQLAKSLNAPVIALSALNRESNKEIRPPRLSDLRASGQIEYDADKVWLLHSKDEPTVIPRNIVLNVAKNKDGAGGEVELIFIQPLFKIESAAHVE